MPPVPSPAVFGAVAIPPVRTPAALFPERCSGVSPVLIVEFLIALQRIDATHAPLPGAHNYFRGAPPEVYDAEARQAIDTLGDSIDADGATSVPGLFAAGDAASREPVVGATSGGGGPNSTWAIASGFTAGRSAAAHAAALGPSAHQRRAQRADQRDQVTATAIDAGQAAFYISVAQAAMFPLERNFTRDAAGLRDSLDRLDDARRSLCEAERTSSDPRGRRREREIAAMLATARWICASALERRETRGIHRRRDFPAVSDAPVRGLKLRGIDEHKFAWA